MELVTTVNDQVLRQALRCLGISRLGVEVYLLIFSDSKISVTKLAKLLSLSRPTLYKILNELESHQLVKKVQKESSAFEIASPSEILHQWQTKQDAEIALQQNYLQQLPTLLEKYEQGTGPTLVKIIKGSDAFVKLFFQILEEENNVTEFFGSAEDFIQFISWDIDKKWIKKRVKKQVLLRTLLIPSQDSRQLKRLDKQQYRETRALLGMRPFETSFQLFANKVIFWQPKSPLAVLVEDQFIVQMMRSIFYYCWEREG